MESADVRVLLVEDDRQLATMLEEVLTDEGYVVDVARDGQRGLHLGLTRTYDLVVLDRGLPAIEGLDLLARLRGRGVTTPTLVLSALGADRRARFSEQSQNGTPSRPPPPLPGATRPR